MIKVFIISDLTGGLGGVYTYLNQLQSYAADSFSVQTYLDSTTEENVLRNGAIRSAKFIPLSPKFHDRKLIVESVKNEIEKHKPDVIHMVNGSIRSNLPIREFLVANDIKFVVTEQYVDDSMKLDDDLHRRILDVNISTAHTIYVSDTNAQIAAEVFHIKNGKRSVIHNGIVPLRKKTNFREKPFRLFTTGRCVPQKGIDLIIRAIALIPEKKIEFHLIGDGEYKTEYLELAAKLLKDNHRFVIHDWKSTLDYAELIDEYDLFISASRQEGLSYSLLEAATSGFPMICSDCAGNVELIERCDRGLLFERENFRQLSRLIDGFLSAPEELNNKALKNTLLVDEKFDIEKLIKNLHEIYGSNLNNCL